MRWFFVGALGVSALAMGGQEALCMKAPMAESRAPLAESVESSKSSKSSKAKKARRGVRSGKRRAGPVSSLGTAVRPNKKVGGGPAPGLLVTPTGPRMHPASVEPAPAGEQAVYWALPQSARLHVKIRLAPSREATALGEMRGDTAVPIRL